MCDIYSSIPSVTLITENTRKEKKTHARCVIIIFSFNFAIVLLRFVTTISSFHHYGTNTTWKIKDNKGRCGFRCLHLQLSLHPQINSTVRSIDYLNTQTKNAAFVCLFFTCHTKKVSFRRGRRGRTQFPRLTAVDQSKCSEDTPSYFMLWSWGGRRGTLTVTRQQLRLPGDPRSTS